MKISELCRSKWLVFKEYALTITAVRDEADTLDGVREIRQAILDWIARRGKKATSVMILVTSARLPDEETRQSIVDRYRADEAMVGIGQEQDLRMAFVDDEGEALSYPRESLVYRIGGDLGGSPGTTRS